MPTSALHTSAPATPGKLLGQQKCYCITGDAPVAQETLRFHHTLFSHNKVVMFTQSRYDRYLVHARDQADTIDRGAKQRIVGAGTATATERDQAMRAKAA